MTAEELSDLRQYTWMPSRIPALDALSTFVPQGQERDAVVSEMSERVGSSRWFPVSGCHRVLFPYEGGAFDSQRFTLERGAWDHEHCKVCSERIPPMTLCWVTESGPYIILCESCHGEVAG